MVGYFRDGAFAPRGRGTAIARGSRVAPVRRAVLTIVFVVFIAGSLYDIVRDEEHWPFSQYPMFSGVWRSSTFEWVRLFGVTTDGTEFPLDENRYIRPFDQSRLPKALKQMMEEPDAPDRLQVALRDCLSRYAQLAAAGRHDGPPLAGMRLYELAWALDPVPSPVHRPDRRQLIAEVYR